MLEGWSARQDGRLPRALDRMATGWVTWQPGLRFWGGGRGVSEGIPRECGPQVPPDLEIWTILRVWQGPEDTPNRPDSLFPNSPGPGMGSAGHKPYVSHPRTSL